MALAQIAFYISTPIASAVSGPLLNAAGFAGTFAVCACCAIAALTYFATTVTETRGRPGHAKTAVRDFVLDCGDLYKAFVVIFKPRSVPWKRLQIIGLAFVPYFIMVAPMGEMTTLQLYVRQVQ